MLSPTRVIGHKEYGNRPPGGWPGRKQDPTYDMDWRRGRVASFRPRTGGAPTTPQEEDDVRFKVFRSDPTQGAGRDKGTGQVALAAPGIWYVVPDPAYWDLLKAYGVCEPTAQQVPHNVWLYFQAVYTIPEWNDEDLGRRVAAVDSAVRALAESGSVEPPAPEPMPVGQLDPAAVDALADALVTRMDARARDGDPATGPVS